MAGVEIDKETHPEGLTPFQEHLAQQLFEIGAIKFGDFRLKLHDKKPEAPLSPIYIDLRVLRRFPEAKQAAVAVYEGLVHPLRFDLIADVPTAATPLASTLSDRLGVGMITPRADAKIHGSGTKIDGLQHTDRGKTAVLIDDLVTNADSKLEAIDILEAEGVQVKDVVVLVDRAQGGKQQLAKDGYALHAAMTMQQILEFYVRTGQISQERYCDVQQRLEALNQLLGL